MTMLLYGRFVLVVAIVALAAAFVWVTYQTRDASR
jgi:cell division protein FtsL